MPILTTKGAASAAGLGFSASSGPVNYIEDVFSTYLYTGNSSTQTITNGIDLAGKGGLVWTKNRTNAYDNYLYDTARGVNKVLLSNNTIDQQSLANTLTAFNSTGFTLGNSDYGNITNGAAAVSWSWAKAPKFFDVVTYTGTGSATTIAHSLGSVPGCIIIKRTDTTSNWVVYHRSLNTTAGGLIALNLTFGELSDANAFNSTVPTSTVFTVGSASSTNGSGGTFVAYVFAHNAGGFGLTGTDNVISCGSFTTDGGGNATVSLGYEPQWFLRKRTDSTGNWTVVDNMRGFTADGTDAFLYPNLNNAEATSGGSERLTSTGVQITGFAASITFIYIAIRRGPMKVPTSGTSVFDPEAYSGDNSNTRVITTGFPPDMVWTGTRANGSRRVGDRLRGLFINPGPVSTTSSTSDEQLDSYSSPQMNGWQTGNGTVRFENSTGVDYVLHAFKRAPSFFDVCCYTGNGSTQNVSHNLGVAPEMIILKNRDDAGTDWWVYAAPLTTPQNKYLRLQSTGGESTATGLWGSSLPTSTTFGLGNFSPNQNTKKFVSYLFATCAGVSKVGSFSYATGSSTNVDCGFTSGARFVMIKQSDGVDSWYVFDTARGIVAGNDPFIELNSSAAENSGFDAIDPYSAGFTIPAGALGTGTFIFLAIA